MSTQRITHEMVIDHYSNLARENKNSNTSHIQKVAESFGYTPEDLSSIPEGANLGVSCGNPLVVAGLKPGETVLDLGSGAGFDVFQAARKVGPTGLSLGIDMSSEMLARAKANAEKASITNVKFVQAPITAIPLEDESVDCVISNCVINLLEQEQKVICFKEVFRVLKLGGRLAVSDILAKKVIEDSLRRDLGLYVGCVSGAALVEETDKWLREAGFEDIMIVDKNHDLNVYKEREVESQNNTACCSTTDPSAPASTCCDQKSSRDSMSKVNNIDFNEWVSSYSIYAIKPTT